MFVNGVVFSLCNGRDCSTLTAWQWANHGVWPGICLGEQALGHALTGTPFRHVEELNRYLQLPPGADDSAYERRRDSRAVIPGRRVGVRTTHYVTWHTRLGGLHRQCGYHRHSHLTSRTPAGRAIMAVEKEANISVWLQQLSAVRCVHVAFMIVPC
ncbi:hypothetical protein EJ06DRAFT_60375 [Trichodelitschia bisporula]|uniref:Uncharacterized protein n=1 Tax=Trichodelitschia bisporula TaxID=703511 RepID=A0A6G1HU92_9PEZI|nr:hypothetical protein EJ06DRAFT_60375 [Trichodelitschia bisporula]